MKKFHTFIALGSILLSSNSNAVNAISNKGFRADMSFLDFEEITHLFKPKHKQVVHIITHKNSPVEIIEAEVSDRGTVFFEGFSGAKNTYSVEVKNTSGRDILAYEVTWVLKHPFEDYVFHKIHTNSINRLKANATQELKFRRGKHSRDDAYYYAEISKVEFDDNESIWEAPELENYKVHTQLDEVKKQIDDMEEVDGDSIDDETLRLLKEKYSGTPNEDLTDEELKDKVLLEEIKPEDKVEETKQELIEIKSETTIEEVIENKYLETENFSSEPILDPQKLMQAVDELIKAKENHNLILQSDLIKAVPIVETKELTVPKIEELVEKASPVVESTVLETKPIINTTPIVETTVIETKPIVETTIIETKPIAETTVIETKKIETITRESMQTESLEEEDDFDFDDDDFEDDDDFDFDDDDFEDDDF
jgi:hypothetical protein